MSSTLRLSEGADVLDVYDYDEEETRDSEFDDEGGEEELDGKSDHYEEEAEKSEDDLTVLQQDDTSQNYEKKEEESPQFDPSLLALAASQQAEKIEHYKTPSPEPCNQSASGEIKKKVYDLLMTTKQSATQRTKSPDVQGTPCHSPRALPRSPTQQPEQDLQSVSVYNGEDYYSHLMKENSLQENYPTKFSSYAIHNYDAVYGLQFSQNTAFPIEKEVSDESIQAAAACVSPPPEKSHPNPTGVLTDISSKVNDTLGGEQAVKKISKNIEAAALDTKVKMLRETTKNLRCYHMVDMIFGDDVSPKRPSPGDLRRLKNIIAVELTLNEFIKSSKVTDVRSAELFKKSNENLEMVQRQQIMSNPLFSSTAHLVVDKRQEPDAENNLHMELFNLLNSKADPWYKLSNRVNFLNRLIHHKTANNISWTKLVNLVSKISSQAAVVIFGDGEEQNMREDGLATTIAMDDYNAVKDMSMGSIGMDLLFGAASDMLEKNMTRVCTDIGELALFFNIPVVLLQWPQEFIKTDEYKKILMRSISSFSVKMTIPSMYVIEQIMLDGDEKYSDGEEEKNDPTEIFSESDKKASINKLYKEILSGEARDRDLMRSIFHGPHHQVTSDKNLLDVDTAYSAAASIIDYKIPLFDNIMSGVIKYLDKRKHLISVAVIKLLRKAKLNITVYCIRNKLNNVSAKCDGNDEEPMKNLMYRTISEKRASVMTGHHRPASLKRPPPNILSERVKRLQQSETTISSDESEQSD